MNAKLFRAARDHLERADAILSRADGDALSERTVIRYVVLMLDEKAEPVAGKVIPLAGYLEGRLVDRGAADSSVW